MNIVAGLQGGGTGICVIGLGRGGGGLLQGGGDWVRDGMWRYRVGEGGYYRVGETGYVIGLGRGVTWRGGYYRVGRLGPACGVIGLGRGGLLQGGGDWARDGM